MVVVDAHHHLGPCDHFLVNVEWPEVRSAMDGAKIEKFLLMPFPGNPDPKAEHDKITKVSDEMPSSVFGIAAVNPIRFGLKASLEEIERAVTSLNFRCVKIHTIAWGLFPFSPLSEKIIEKARDLNVPVMIHTGGSLFADPAHVDQIAPKYPDVNFILAHMGWVSYAAGAMEVAKRNPNVYVETSWSLGYDIKQAVETLGANRVMMGSDLPSNAATEVTKIKSLGLTEDQSRMVLGETAKKIFKL